MSLFNKVQSHFQHTLEKEKSAHDSMRNIGITSGNVALACSLGWPNNTLKDILSKDEHEEAKKLGLMTKNNLEQFYNALSLPLYKDRSICGFVGWRCDISRKKFSGQDKSGFVNHEALENNDQLIVTDAFVTYLMLRQEGFDNVVYLPFDESYDYFVSELQRSAVERVYVTGRYGVDNLINALSEAPQELNKMKLDTRGGIAKKAVIKGLESAVVVRVVAKKPKPKKTIDNGQHVFTFLEMTYYVKPLNLTSASLKCILTAQMADDKFTDRIDLYIASSRRVFSKSCASMFVDDAGLIESDLHKIITEVEKIRDSKTTAEIYAQDVIGKDEEEAKAVLMNPNMLDEFVTDMRSNGFVGEEINLKLGLLMSISRLLDKPLSVIVQSSSGSGKSFLLNALCDITPPESLIFMSKLTPSSLYYMPDLRHKLLCVDESHGSEGSLYPLRTLQSNHKLVLACPMKDGATGSTVTKQIMVMGPVSFMESTTSDSLHPENASRAIILKMDESPEQTMRILESQRQAVIEGNVDSKDELFKKWQNVQRLLGKRKLKIYIPFAHHLKFPTGPNARRDNQKMLSLIQAVALLRSFQRSIQDDCVLADVDDYRIAFDLLVPQLSNAQDELSERAKDLLKILTDRERTPFTRRQLMEDHGLPYSKVWRSMAELIKQEIIVEDITPSGQAPRYILLDTYIPNNDCKGLLSPEQLHTLFTNYSGGVNRLSHGIAKG